jgi:serine protease AprX
MYRSLFSLLFVSALYSALFADSDPLKKIDHTLIDKFDRQTVAEYIILMKDRNVFEGKLPFKTKQEKARYVYASLLQKAQMTQAPILAILNKSKITYQSFYVTNAIKVTSSLEVMLSLASRNDVGRIIDNAPIKMLDYTIDRDNSTARGAEPEWGLKMIKADSVWLMGFRGEGVIIAGQDTGYDWDLSPLKKKYKGYKDSLSTEHNYNWHDAIHKNNPRFADTLLNPCGYSTKEPCDDNNHGTHTMGTMVGEDSENSIGVAPEAKWIACRNMDRGWGQPSTYMECFEWFLAPYDLNGENADPDKAPHVINNSWYCSTEEGCNESNFLLMEELVKNLKASGVVVVVSAGNTGGAGCGSVSGPPAFFESSFSVGATNIDDNIAGFSSRGPVVVDSSFRLKPNVSAPGVSVRSVIRGGNFASFNGTSMAGPHVAGLVGLIISANPALAGNVDMIEDIIEATAVPKTWNQDCGEFSGAEVPNAIFGYGRVDALAAVKRALAFTSDTEQEDNGSNIMVFPNPGYDLVSFHFSGGDEGIEDIEIYDINGRKWLQEHYSDTHILRTIQINTLPEGIYIYHIKAGKKWLNGKFVKI